ELAPHVGGLVGGAVAADLEDRRRIRLTVDDREQRVVEAFLDRSDPDVPGIVAGHVDVPGDVVLLLAVPAEHDVLAERAHVLAPADDLVGGLGLDLDELVASAGTGGIAIAVAIAVAGRVAVAVTGAVGGADADLADQAGI